MLASLPEKEKPACVDLACGTGDITRMLANRYFSGHVTGLDLTPAMLKIADELLAREILDAKQVLRLAKGLDLEEDVPEPIPPTGDTSDTPRPEAAERPPIVPPMQKPITQA